MKKCLGALLIALGVLISFNCLSVSAGAGQKDCRLAIAECRLPSSAEVGQTVNAETNQEKTATQQTKTTNQEKTVTQESKSTSQEKKPVANLQDYVGRYEADPSMVENFIFDVYVEKDELWIKPSHERKSILAAKGTDSFVIIAVNGPIRFTRDSKGLVQSLTLEPAAAAHAQPLTAKKLILPAPSLKGNTTFHLKGYPNARVVAVAGSFNDWKQSQVICGKEGDGWVCRLDLAPGKYTYKFIIDGDWILDPDNASTESDERGFENSVLVVK